MKQITELVSLKQNSDGDTLFCKLHANGINTNLNNSSRVIMRLTIQSCQALASTQFYTLQRKLEPNKFTDKKNFA